MRNADTRNFGRSHDAVSPCELACDCRLCFSAKHVMVLRMFRPKIPATLRVFVTLVNIAAVLGPWTEAGIL